jgi:hypothetical protein
MEQSFKPNNLPVKFLVKRAKDGFIVYFYHKHELKFYKKERVSNGEVSYLLANLRSSKSETFFNLFSKKITDGLNRVVIANAFQGGTFRARYYFPLYYYPLKILLYYRVVTEKGKSLFLDKERLANCKALEMVR